MKIHLLKKYLFIINPKKKSYPENKLIYHFAQDY